MKNKTIGIQVPASPYARRSGYDVNFLAAYRAAMNECEEERKFATGANWERIRRRERYSDVRVMDYV